MDDKIHELNDQELDNVSGGLVTGDALVWYDINRSLILSRVIENGTPRDQFLEEIQVILYGDDWTYSPRKFKEYLTKRYGIRTDDII